MNRVPGLAERVGQRAYRVMNALRDGFESFGSVVNGIHRSHDGKKHLRGADVASGFVAADVLLAGLQGKAQGGIAGGIFREPDQTSGQAAFVVVLGREKRSMRTAITERHAETLRATDHDVRTEFAGRLDQGESEKIGRNDECSTDGMDTRGKVTVVIDFSVRRGVLHQRAEAGLVERSVGPRSRHDLDTERFRTCAEKRDGLRVDVVRNEEFIALTLDAVRHGHGLGGRGGFVE